MKRSHIVLLTVLAMILIGYLLPERTVIPVAKATPADWNPQSFWYHPWGPSGVHKGIDIFGPLGTDVLSATDGVVLFAGQVSRGGNVVLILGPKWRLHYFAHLHSVDASPLHPVAAGEPIGTLGDSGNAKGKPPHLHYAIVRLVPAPWAMDGTIQGYKKAFYMDPNAYLRAL
jgi:peptidoglycan LD-endopeptidase LytH